MLLGAPSESSRSSQHAELKTGGRRPLQERRSTRHIASYDPPLTIQGDGRALAPKDSSPVPDDGPSPGFMTEIPPVGQSSYLFAPSISLPSAVVCALALYAYTWQESQPFLLHPALVFHRQLRSFPARRLARQPTHSTVRSVSRARSFLERRHGRHPLHSVLQ